MSHLQKGESLGAAGVTGMGHRRFRDPIALFRRHMHRSFRHYFYGSLMILVFYLMYRWKIAPSSKSRFIDVDRIPPDVPPDQLMRPELPKSEDIVPQGNIVLLSVFIEAQCPDTTRFVHKQLWPSWQLLSSTARINLSVIPFGKARCLPYGEDFSCQCQHGPFECELNQLMNCVIDIVGGYPDKYMPFIQCIQGKTSLEHARLECIVPHPQIPMTSLMECASGPRGRRLLALSGQNTANLNPPLTFVPWILINGERSVDAMYDLRENLCNNLSPAPPQCVS